MSAPRMTTALRVGIIGASAEGGWARESHVPAVKALAGLALAAIATNSQATADASARAFGVTGYGDAMDLIRAPDIDLVTVAVRVPAHRALVLAALAAGKHVLCEWPLGRNTAEAAEMEAAARAAGVHAAIGLQTRASPAARRAAALIAAGALGRVLSVRVSSATAAFGPHVPDAMLYAEDPANGANLVTIQGAHSIDLAIAVAGPLQALGALASAQYPEVTLDDGVRRPRATFDHLLLQARIADGAPLAVEVSGGRPPETPFRLEVISDKGRGETGLLALEGGAARGFQSGRLRLLHDGTPEPVDEGELASLSDTAANVGGLYAMLRDDIANGTSLTPDFSHAVRLSKLVDDVLASARDGHQREAAGWPGR